VGLIGRKEEVGWLGGFGDGARMILGFEFLFQGWFGCCTSTRRRLEDE
jgi:hypothetical protein